MDMILQCEGRTTPDSAWVSMKTQFLTPDVHVWIVGLLKCANNERSPSFARCFSQRTHSRTSLYRSLKWSDSCCLGVLLRHMVCLTVANRERRMFATTLDAVKAQKWREEKTRPECVFRYFSKAAARSRSQKARATRSPQGRCLAVCNTSPALCRRRRSWRSSVSPV